MSLAHSWLLKMDPERAHRIAVNYLKLGQRFVKKPSFSVPPTQLSLLDKLEFLSPVGVAAGLDKNAEYFAALAAMGFGFAEIGAVTPKAQIGNPKPRLFRIESQQAVVNYMGFNNVGVEAFRKNVLAHRHRVPWFPLLVNLGKGKDTPIEKSVADYAFCAHSLADCVDGFVADLSSPNTPGVRSLQNEDFFGSLVEAMPEGKPLLIKIAPDLGDDQIADLAQYVSKNEKVVGLVVANTSRSLAQKNGFDRGGLSGTPLFERALECVKIARENMAQPKVLIAVGGIDRAERAIQMREAGADLIQVYTAFIYQGPKLIDELTTAFYSQK